MDSPSSELDDLHAQFLIAVAELCSAAELGGLRVEAVLRGGTRVCGVPASLRPAADDEQVDNTGYARTFRINDSLVNLDDILACAIHAPIHAAR